MDVTAQQFEELIAYLEENAQQLEATLHCKVMNTYAKEVDEECKVYLLSYKTEANNLNILRVGYHDMDGDDYYIYTKFINKYPDIMEMIK